MKMAAACFECGGVESAVWLLRRKLAKVHHSCSQRQLNSVVSFQKHRHCDIIEVFKHKNQCEISRMKKGKESFDY